MICALLKQRLQRIKTVSLAWKNVTCPYLGGVALKIGMNVPSVTRTRHIVREGALAKRHAPGGDLLLLVLREGGKSALRAWCTLSEVKSASAPQCLPRRLDGGPGRLSGFGQRKSRLVLNQAASQMVPRRGLEPPRSYPLVPETSASTNSATWAGTCLLPLTNNLLVQQICLSASAKT